MNLTKFTEHFNNMSYWTRTIILQQPDAKVWKMPIRIMVIVNMLVFNNFRPRSASATWWSSSRLWSGFGRWTTSTLTSPSSPHWTQRQSGDLVNISSCMNFTAFGYKGAKMLRDHEHQHYDHHPHVQSGKRRSRTGWQNIAPSSTRLLHSERTGKHQSCIGHQVNTSVHSAFYLALVEFASSSFF